VNEAPLSRTLIRFGIFELDTETRELRKQGVKVRLQEQPLQVLQILLERHGKVVTREELQQRIWPSDTFVDFEGGLYNAIKRLREALGDAAERPRFIETLSRRGYRFIASVEGNGYIAAPTPIAELPKFAHARNLRLGIALGFVAAIVVGTALVVGKPWQRLSRGSAVPQIRSIAVLPLQNLSNDPIQEYFSDGMTDALITDLAQISALKVVSRTTALRYKDTHEPLPQIAREMNVDGIVEGTVQRSGDHIRVTAQLIYGPADQHLWARSYDREVEDMLALQSTVAGEIADEIRVKVTREERARMKNARPVNPKALDAYVEARFHFDQADKLEFYNGKNQELQEEIRKGVSYLDRAIQEDPGYIPAYVAYFNGAVDSRNFPHLEYLPKAKAALTKALALDESNEPARLASANLLMQYEYDWAGAEREYKRAIELNPNSAEAHFRYSDYLKCVGRDTESQRELDLAQALNPAHDYQASAGVQRIGQTLEQERQVLDEQAPNDPWALGALAKDYAIAGKYQESVEIYERGLSLLGWNGFADALRKAGAKGGPKFALEEWMRAAEKYSATHDDFSIIPIAFTYASLGNKDRAFVWLDKAVQQRSWLIVYLKNDNVWDALRSDPRFADLLRHVGLPQ
jgi:TolB-like protein/DNA-binding winged helix-turn-helix (wHTH) protein